MRIGVLSDTHIPDRTSALPDEIIAIFAGVDLILHAGDISVPSVLERLRVVAPVVAVQGNRDGDALPDLPLQTIVSAGRWRIGLIHGMRPRSTETADRLRYLCGDHRFSNQRTHVLRAFAGDTVHCIVFGHTHQVCRETRHGILLFNPGGVVRSLGGGPSSVGIIEAGSEGITAEVIVLRQPQRRYTVIEQIQQAAARLGVQRQRYGKK